MQITSFHLKYAVCQVGAAINDKEHYVSIQIVLNPLIFAEESVRLYQLGKQSKTDNSKTILRWLRVIDVSALGCDSRSVTKLKMAAECLAFKKQNDKRYVI